MTCDEQDNYCDGETDEGLTLDFYPDADEDGFGDMEEAAAHKAWTAVHAKWEKSVDGNWVEKVGMPSEALPTGDEVLPAEPILPMEAFRVGVKRIVAGFKEALAEMAGDGITGVTGSSGQQLAEADETQRRTELYQRAGLTEAEAKIAVRGRSQ